MRPTRVLARRLRLRAGVSALAVAVFGWASLAAVAAALRAPNVPSITLALIATSWAVAVVVMAAESVGGSVLLLSEAGYRTGLTPLRPWPQVVRIATGWVDNQRVPVVARRDEGDFPVAEDTLTGFAEPDADRALAAFSAWAPAAGHGDFSSVVLPPAHRAAFEATADRVTAEVRAATGREPGGRVWAEFGFPGLVSALVLDYGINAAGEGVQVIVRHAADVALLADGRRHLRVTKRRSLPVAAQVGVLFGEHTTTEVPSRGTGFDQLRVDAPGQRPAWFNAEEPDRYR